MCAPSASGRYNLAQMNNRIPLLLVFLLALAVLGCGGDESRGPAIEESSPTPSQTCGFEGVALTELGQAIVGLQVTGRSKVRVDERRWKGATEETTKASEDGSFSFSVPCGSSLSLDFLEWSWPIEPDHLIVKPGMKPMAINLVPERMVMLRLESAPGHRIEGQISRFAAPGIEAATLPVPVGGIQLDAVSWGRVEGEIHAEGYPSRTWKLSRSHELSEVAPDRFEAVMVMGPTAPVWLEVPPDVLRQVQGAWCVSLEGRGGACKRMRSGWFCDCAGATALAVTSGLWGTALVREVVEGNVQLPQLPKGIEECFSGSPRGTYHVSPPGLQVDPLVAVEIKVTDDRACTVLPEGEPLVVHRSDWSGSFVVRGGERRLPSLEQLPPSQLH